MSGISDVAAPVVTTLSLIRIVRVVAVAPSEGFTKRLFICRTKYWNWTELLLVIFLLRRQRGCERNGN